MKSRPSSSDSLAARLALAEEALRRSEASRRESQEYFEKSFFSNPALMALADATDGRLIEVNRTFIQATGYSRDEAIGHSTSDLGLWVDRAQRDRFIDLVRTQGAARDFEAQFRSRPGALRHVLLTADIIEIGGRRCMLTVGIDITERRRREREQDAVFQISQAANAGGDLQALFQRLHEIIGSLLTARNLYFALVSPDGKEISFPYYHDEVSRAPVPRPRGRSLTDYVADTKRPLLARLAERSSQIAAQGYQPTGTPSAIWLGAPLIVDDRIIGVVAVQDYHDESAYDEESKRLLTFVAEQAAAAVDRRRTETLRRESEEYFAKSFHTSPALMAIASLDTGRIVETNEAFLRASGYRRDEVLGRTSLDLGLWADPSRRDGVMAELVAKGAVHGYEATFLTKHGEPRHVLLNADLFELSGRPAMLITAIDLTDRRHRDRMQRATYRISNAVLAGRELPELFREIHETLSGLLPARNCYVALLSADGRHLTFPYFADEYAANPGFVPPPRPRGLGFTDYVLELGRPVMINSDELTARLRERGDYHPLARPPALRLGAPLRIGGRTLGVIAIHDYRNPTAYAESDLELLNFVAEQAAAAVQSRIAEEALQRAERQYRGIFENAVEGLYQSSPDGRFLQVNPAFARMLGYDTPAQVVHAVNDIGAQLYRDARRRAEFMALIRHADEVSDFESEALRADGSHLWISESVRVIRDTAGVPILFEGVAIDITARREADRALRAAKEAADEASRAKTHFLASMSHELRTPLNGILGYTQILRRDPGLNDKQRSGVGIIHQSAEHLLALINDVLDLAKIEARKLELHPSEFGLPEFGQNVAEVFAPRAREKNLRLETAFASDLPHTVVADAQRLRQVLFNLLSNAVKFTEQGGVVFSIERSPAGALRFSVSDSGPGITPEDQARLFEPFAQLGNQVQRSGGTGLGLNVSRSILERMNTQLQVESRPGWGSRFWFDLVLPEGSGAADSRCTATPWRITGYEGDRRRVLVADDHEPNRALLVDLLSPLGFEVLTANDGEQAVRLAREARPHLALLDLRMPHLDGLDASRRIRAELGAAAPVIIGISASAHDQQHAAALAAGCAAFIAKPFRDEDLFALIARHLGLVWRQTEGPAPGETAAPFPMLTHPPGAEQAERLFELASSGDVLAVRAYAQEIAAADPRLAAFAAQVTDLAARFKMKAIRSLVSRYREQPKG